MSEVKPEWVAADWGTSHLRVWAMKGSEVLASADAPDGMGKLARDEFEPALLRLIGNWIGDTPLPVIACGMVGARQGWQEAPYRMVPCAPVATGETMKVATHDPRIAVEIVPGLAQDEPADVIRGEEVQIAGFLAETPDFDGVLIMPGTHSKRVRIEGGKVLSFATAMTGELFELLSTASVLRHGMAGEDWDDAAFEGGVADGLAGVAFERLFPLRAQGLLHGLTAGEARARLSGLLIGAEARAIADCERAVLIGAAKLCALYKTALEMAGKTVDVADGSRLVRNGLTALWQEGAAKK